MKKLLFLISLCLLSQNISIAGESLGVKTGSIPPVPSSTQKQTPAKNQPKTQPAAKSAVPVPAAKQHTQPVTNNKPVKQTQENNNTKVPLPAQKNAAKPVQTHTPAAKETSQTKPAVSKQEKPVTKQEKPAKKSSLVPVPGFDTPIPAENKSTKQFAPLVKEQPKKVEKGAEKEVENEVEKQPEKVVEEQKPKKFDLHADVKSEVQAHKKPPVIVEKLPVPADPSETRVVIKRVEFTGSRVFTEKELQELASPLLSRPVSLEDIKKVINGITRCYLLGDYPTSKAYLPPQTISQDGVLKIGLFEGTVGDIKVEGNRWTRTPYITKKISVKEGDLFRLGDIEKDVVKFNNNNVVKLRVGLNAGDEPGETDIVLNAEDPCPFHLAFMTDNQGRQTIGRTRWGGMLAADSLFGYRDRLSLGGYLGTGNRVGFADYNIPVGKYGTRIGASVSAGNIDVVRGPLRPFGIGGTSQVYSLYATQPLFDRQGINISSYTAANLKHSTTDISGFKINDVGTFSVTQGFTGRKDTEKGVWYTGHYGSVGFQALGGDTDFFKYEGNITRLHDFGKGIVGQFRVSGQYSPNDRLPWMEQFQIGGLSTVRGYSEGLLLGKSGYFASAEILAPIPILPKRIGSDKLGYIYPRDMVKAAVFMDNGMIFPYKGGASIDGGELLMSWGWGLRFNLKKDLAARLYWGYGLKNRYEVDQKMGRLHFDVTCAPDIGRILGDRKPAEKKKKDKKKDKKKSKETL